MMPTYTIRNENILNNAIAYAKETWKLYVDTKRPLVIEFGRESNKRSSRANKYYWAVLHQIEEQCWLSGKQYASEVWHDYMKRRFIGVIDIPVSGTMAMSTSGMHTEEFLEYVTKVEICAQQELGVNLVDMSEPSGYFK